MPLPYDVLEPAFYVGNIKEDFDPSVLPATGEDYIRRVILEASRCEEVVVAPVDKSKLRKPTLQVCDLPGCIPAPPDFLPSKEWQQCQVADFAALRQSTARQRATNELSSHHGKPPPVPLPDKEDEIAWCQFCFGKQFLQKVREVNDIEDGEIIDTVVNNDDETSKMTDVYGDGIPPLLSVLTAMSQPVVEQVLEYHVNWLEVHGFSARQGRWLYALLSFLECPLTPETCSLLRTLARICSGYRASLDSADHPFLPPLNLLVCLVALYFNQIDLADS